MPRGRPQKTRFRSDDPNVTWQEVIVIGTDDRVNISSDSARCRSWLVSGSELLAVLRPNRVVSLGPLEEGRTQVEDLVRTSVESADAASETIALAAQIRYLRLRVDSDSRIRIPKDVRLCLGLDPIRPDYVRLVIRRNDVRIEAAAESDYLDAEDALADFDLP